jgi:Eukaryotic aspartyl protease
VTDKEITITPSDYVAPVILDSGTTLTYLPQNLVDTLIGGFNSVEDPSTGEIFVDCDLASSNGALIYGFGGDSGPKIKVGLSELVFTDQKVQTYNGVACLFGIMSAGDNPNLLGDTFLRSAYVVYDLENNQCALAQTNFDATDSNVTELTSAGVQALGAGSVTSVTAHQTATEVPHPGFTVASGSVTGSLTKTSSGIVAGTAAATGASSSSTASSAAKKQFIVSSYFNEMMALSITVVSVLFGSSLFVIQR